MTIAQKKFVLYSFVLISIGAQLYISFVPAKPPVSPQLGLSEKTILLLRIAISLLYWPIWFFGARAVSLLWEYAERLSKIQPLRQIGYRRIGYGLLWLVGNLAIASIVSGYRNLLDPLDPAARWLTIVTNYIYVVLPLLGITLLFSGARLLEKSDPHGYSPNSSRENRIISLIFSCVVTVLYVFLVFTNPSRTVSDDPLTRPSYYLNDIAIVLTIIIPSFFLWFTGVLAAFQLDRFSPEEFSVENIRGQRQLVNGIWAIIFSTIIIQVLLSLGGVRLINLGLGFLILAVYGFLILLVSGYFMAMRGAVKLLAHDRDVET